MKNETKKLGLTTFGLLFFITTIFAQKTSVDERMYRLIDADHSGIVNIEEFKTSKLNVNTSLEKQKTYFNSIDLNNDKKVTLKEFIVSRRAKRATLKFETERIAQQEKEFKGLDSNHNSKITLREYKSAKMNKIASLKLIKENYRVMDTDKDGNIILKEYKTGINKIGDIRKDLIKKQPKEKIAMIENNF